MKRAVFNLLTVALLAIVSPPLRAQTFDATHLGTPAAAVTGNWRVHYGDDPHWAAPDFNDAQWQSQPADNRITLTRPYKGYLWYRMRVQLPVSHGQMSISVDGCNSVCQFFANGHLIGQSGGMPPKESIYEGRLLEFPLAIAPDVQSVEIAVRAWASSMYKPGLPRNNVRIGDSGAIANEVRDNRRLIDEFSIQNWIVNAISLLLSFALIALFAYQNERTEYLWLALWQGCMAIGGSISALRDMSIIPDWTQYNIAVPLQFLSLLFTVEFYYSFLKERPGRAMRVLEALVLLTLPLGPFLLYGHVTPRVYGIAVLIPEFELISIAVVLTAMLVVRFRRGNKEAGLLLIPTVLTNLSTVIGLAQEAGYSLGWIKTTKRLLPDTHFGDFVFTTDTWCSISFLIAILVLLVYRFLNVSREQTRSAAEIEAARQVQQVLLPEQVLTVPGVTIESEYHPANVVGGDFFQVIPAADGSLLVVVGDVAGKGMGAAMLVGVIIGTIRTAVQFDADPAFLLSTLNERLCGRVNGSFVTCLAARLTPDGELVLANAGHLSPYLNGQELATIPELPLGVAEGAVYAESRFSILAGDRLAFVSDGVVEATTPTGELFGFDRTRDISRSPASVIAHAAKDFGQTDDITVVTLTRDLQLMPAV